jgi:nucleotide-binding universal stress UspA family protein
MVFEKILVPLDGSEHSSRALEVAIQLAKQLKSKLLLFTVYSMVAASGSSPELSLMAIDASRDRGKEILKTSEERARLESIEVETELASGTAVEAILEKSKEGKFDMIIMGARGLGTMKKLFIGSVSEGVVKNAPCPVLVVK